MRQAPAAGQVMNFNEAIKLHRTVVDFWSKTFDSQPKIGFYDIQIRELGYIICVKMPLERCEFEQFLKKLSSECNLEFGRFKGYYVIHSAGHWNPMED
jgi:hypothetical protein